MNIKWLGMVLLILFIPLLGRAEPIVKFGEEVKMHNKHVLISGAGISGLTLAYWLKQHGFVPTVIEKYPVLRTGGIKIDIRGVALEVVKRMGAYDSIFEARTDIQG